MKEYTDGPFAYWHWSLEQENQKIINAARTLAQQAHAGQVRRESGKSFFEAHLEPVAKMVQERGNAPYNDFSAISIAYLHDIIEDVEGGDKMLWSFALDNEMPYIQDGVIALTEEGESWEDRKSSYLAKIECMDARRLLVSLCDKVVTGRDFVEEWQRGQLGKRPSQIVWFYQAVHHAYLQRHDVLNNRATNFPLRYDDLLAELTSIAEQLRSLYEGATA